MLANAIAPNDPLPDVLATVFGEFGMRRLEFDADKKLPIAPGWALARTRGVMECVSSAGSTEFFKARPAYLFKVSPRRPDAAAPIGGESVLLFDTDRAVIVVDCALGVATIVGK